MIYILRNAGPSFFLKVINAEHGYGDQMNKERWAVTCTRLTLELCILGYLRQFLVGCDPEWLSGSYLNRRLLRASAQHRISELEIT
ncbi:hypothetical protein MAR_035807 [Mya arenaria]|uniref:Uncharacterized protein n=1 Tax=Mya arenaria TaxID=6604 RepID=A0ABY7EPT7_MYAAR|nr:hypothetical protein MAR_035807 [Mya arenaria]